MFKSLQPSDNPDYVLIHKKALLGNTFVIAQMSLTLESFIDLQAATVAEEFGNLARYEVNQMSTEKINADVQTILDNADTENGLTIVVNNSPNIDN